MRDRESEIIGKKLVERLIEIRKDSDLSQYKIAKRSGLSTSGVNSIENDRRIPNIVTCLKLCKAMDVKLWKVLKEIEDAL
ncbi:MAG: helix-turn-helix transcriptional regulator [Bdellovibrionales bacterium]